MDRHGVRVSGMRADVRSPGADTAAGSSAAAGLPTVTTAVRAASASVGGRPYNPNTGNTSAGQRKSTPSLVLGLVGLVAWLIPLIGFPVTITGLVLGIRRKYTAGIILNIAGLCITLINSIVGAVLGAQGKLF